MCDSIAVFVAAAMVRIVLSCRFAKKLAGEAKKSKKRKGHDGEDAPRVPFRCSPLL